MPLARARAREGGRTGSCVWKGGSWWFWRLKQSVHRSDYQAMAKGTIDLVRWRAPVQLLKYATRTVWLKNVNTGYPVEPGF